MSSNDGGRRRVARTSTATRLAASVVAIGLLSLVVATVVGITTGEDLADDLNDQRLRSTAESAAFDVGAQLRALERTTSSLSASRQAAMAVEQFAEAFDELTASLDDDRFDDERDELLAYYRRTYVEPLVGAGRDVQLRDIVPDGSASLYLQYEYAYDIGDVLGPQTIDDADDGSQWTEVHRSVHTVYRTIVNRLDLLDLYLVDPDGIVVYTVNKRADLGTNLQTGPLSGSVVANAFRRTVSNPDLPAVSSDLQFYDAIPGQPVGVVGSPIIVGDDLAGVLLVSYDAATLTDLVTAEETWEEAGLPDTADVYIFGTDGILRSDPRAYLEAPGTYLAEGTDTGRLSDEDRLLIERVGTTVLTETVVDATRDAGLGADEQMRSTTNISGASVLSIAVPVGLETPQWFVAAEIDVDAARGGVENFEEVLVVGAAIFVVLLAFFAVAWANGIIRPVRLISERISRRAHEEDPIVVPPQTPVEIQQLASRLAVMKRTLRSQHEQIAVARQERLDLLRSMVPPSVASRLATGDVRSLEQVPAATVVVLVVVGLADLIGGSTGRADRQLIDRLLGEFDALALDHGVDRIKVVGDAYFAVCGHDRPYIDHVPRSIGFARDAIDAIARIEGGVPLSVAVGVHSGTVTTGMAGGARLVYDVWGPTVALAHQLARRARRDEILLSEESRLLLPDSIPTEPSDDGTVFRVVVRTDEAVTT